MSQGRAREKSGEGGSQKGLRGECVEGGDMGPWGIIRTKRGKLKRGRAGARETVSVCARETVSVCARET
eukprot:331190-Pleurochrysis_carterae.AAC.3